MGKKNKKKDKKATSFKSAGSTLSQSEAKQIAKAKGITVAQATAKAANKGISIGAKLTNQISSGLANRGSSQAQNLGLTRANNNTLTALQGLQGLQLNRNQSYQGSYTTKKPATTQNRSSGYGVQTTRSSTQINPIVGLRNNAGGGGGGGGGGGRGGGNGGGGKTKNDGTLESIKTLYQQQIDDARAEIDEYKNRTAEQIETMQLDFGNTIADVQSAADQRVNEFGYTIADIQSAADQRVNELSDLMMFQQLQSQQTQDLLAQQAMAAEAAYAEQARQAAALGTAYIPDMEESAATVALGDQRSTDKEKKQNSLSELAIVSGLGTNSNPLAGLQLA